MNEPNKERIKLWVEALESGKFRQCQNVLTRIAENGGRSHCCLGVAVVVAMSNDLELTEEVVDNIVEYADVEGNVSSTVLPDAVVEWYGLAEVSPELLAGYDEDGEYSVEATEMNDGKCASFTEIAAAIRKTYGIES